MVMVCQKFEAALLEAVDFAFNSLEKSCRQALYFHLETNFHISRTEIPDKVEEFDTALRLIFKSGAVFLERLILERLCESFEIKFKEKNPPNLVEAISKVRGMVLQRESLLTFSDFGEVATVERERGEKFE